MSLAFSAEIRQAEKKDQKINEIKNQKIRGSSPISEKKIDPRAREQISRN